ncbi:MAG TPA: PIG-L family deacetylase [Verrucomicrobiae bacterium]|jgi:LmbE family N-acetylglucosaminyl deacetylase
MPKTLLAIGAHYDDCMFGIPGILLQAIRKEYRVVVLAIIGDYTNWSPVKGREKELLKVSTDLAHYFGVEMRFLNYASGRFHMTEETNLAVAKVVADVQPDIAFMLWHHDRHPDHEAASAISKVALKQAGTILGDDKVKVPRQIYLFDNGPGHTIGFEPNTFVDVTPEWLSAMEWLGQLMAFVRQKEYSELAEPDGAQVAKTNLARYRGASCGVKYAEAVWAMQNRPTEIL